MARRMLSLSREALASLTPAELEEVGGGNSLTGTETRWCPTINAEICYTLLPRGECA